MLLAVLLAALLRNFPHHLVEVFKGRSAWVIKSVIDSDRIVTSVFELFDYSSAKQCSSLVSGGQIIWPVVWFYVHPGIKVTNAQSPLAVMIYQYMKMFVSVIEV